MKDDPFKLDPSLRIKSQKDIQDHNEKAGDKEEFEKLLQAENIHIRKKEEPIQNTIIPNWNYMESNASQSKMYRLALDKRSRLRKEGYSSDEINRIIYKDLISVNEVPLTENAKRKLKEADEFFRKLREKENS